MSAIETHELVETSALPQERNVLHGAWLYEAGLALLQCPHDEAVNRFLAWAGHAADADRAWMLRYNHDATLFRNTHEWCREGITGHCDDLQDVPVAMIDWLHEVMVRNQAVMVRTIAAMPRSARALRAEFERQGNRSILSVPIFHHGKIWGLIGFDTVREEKSWCPLTSNTLSHCGSLIATATTSRKTSKTFSKPLPEEGVLYLHAPTGKQRVSPEEILGVRAEGDYTRVYLVGRESALELRPLKTWIGLLPKQNFQRIHRGSIVNVRKVEEVEKTPSGQWQLRIAETNEGWSVSKRYRAEVRSRFGF